MIRGVNYITLIRFLLPPPLFKHPSMSETRQATAAKIQKSISKDDSVSSVVQAQLSPKAPAPAWLEGAQAFTNSGPGQSPQ
jgi:hypothetical protein